MSNIISEIILTAGPTISYKEKEYVLDAVINGWNHHHSDYIKKFEKTFAEFIGTKYAIATSSCTGALHLSLLAAGVKKGDEVIVPEITWIATASAVVYTGAKPVFADIEEDTWVLDTKNIEKYITKKTKAIIPVHLYGNVVDMKPLWAIAKKYNLKIIEDAAPSIGAMYKNKKTGNLGDVAAFSFQGAKAVVTGEGGMIVTNDKDIYERAKFLGDHGRNPEKPLESKEIGYKYKMSNIQAALGLAQIERINEIIEKKRQIFKWYYDRLKNIDLIKMNVERKGTKSLYWMTSIVLDKRVKISRDEFIKKLKERNIDTRPFFSPISSFPMFKTQKQKNPVAYDVPLRGINLPSGHERTEEEIDYICWHICDILGVKKSKMITKNQPAGWLKYREEIYNVLEKYKKYSLDDIEKHSIFFNDNSGKLVPVTWDALNNKDEINRLSKWRKKVQNWFPTQFKVTFEGTKKWLENLVLKQKDRILFYVIDNSTNIPIGHVGLYRFNFKEKYCEIDNIVRGEDNIFKGGITKGCITLINWAFEKLKLKTLYLRVFSDNSRAIKLYNNLGFKEIQRIPLIKVKEENIVKWIENLGNPYENIKRYFVTMRLDKNEWKGDK